MHVRGCLMGTEGTIIGNGQTANDVNLIYINRALVPKANLPFRFIRLPFNFMDEPQIHSPTSSSLSQHYFNLSKRNVENHEEQ